MLSFVNSSWQRCRNGPFGALHIPLSEVLQVLSSADYKSISQYASGFDQVGCHSVVFDFDPRIKIELDDPTHFEL